MIVQAISGLIDDIAFEKPLDWESINYDSAKQVAILGAIEQYQDIINNSKLNDEEKETSLVAVFAYLILENTQLWIEISRLKERK
jgi:hypothetical protein